VNPRWEQELWNQNRLDAVTGIFIRPLRLDLNDCSDWFGVFFAGRIRQYHRPIRLRINFAIHNSQSYS